jgi:CHASE2 domain-containing sensor protein
MPLWLAVVLLLLSLLGVVLSRRYLRKPMQTICVILCVLLAVACAAYVGLTILFVDAVQNQPPAQ